ncbi:uncharacterized protein [Typha latifolia]|uniref:uncharacterized protein n=1 Tax=Typha latifolia TaxID=4733 RepID=UPI003C2E53D5
MFASRSSRDGAKAEEGEPSSPKVTCIGQVRIKKSNKDKNPRSKAKPVMRCHCLRNPLLCGAFHVRKSKYRPWRRWGFSFGSGGNLERKSPEKKADCVNSKQEVAIREVGSDHQEIRVQKDEETKNFAPSGTTPPPRNALMLMRSRSAPHNREASSLATRIPISPASKESEEEEEEGKSSKDIGELEEEEEEEEMRCSSSRPLVLTRCKSEPARSGVKLVVPEEITVLGRMWS